MFLYSCLTTATCLKTYQKFAGYVHHYNILTWNIFGLILKNKMAATGVSFFSHEKCLYLHIISPRGLVCKANL